MKKCICGCGRELRNEDSNRSRRFTDPTCQRTFYKWMAKHRRIIAKSCYPCPVCGITIGYYPIIGGGARKTCGSPECIKTSVRRQANKKDPFVKKAYKKIRREKKYKKTNFHEHSQAKKDLKGFRAVYCAHVYSDNKSCANYKKCLDEEMKNPGKGFKSKTGECYVYPSETAPNSQAIDSTTIAFRPNLNIVFKGGSR